MAQTHNQNFIDMFTSRKVRQTRLALPLAAGSHIAFG